MRVFSTRCDRGDSSFDSINRQMEEQLLSLEWTLACMTFPESRGLQTRHLAFSHRKSYTVS